MSIFDTLFGRSASDAANAAAQDTFKKQRKATAAYDAAGDEYLSGLLGLSKSFAPYSAAGGTALEQLLAGLGLGGEDAQNQFIASYRNSPGYRAGLDTGIKSIEGSQNVNHMLKSGNTLRALSKFGMDYEDQNYNNRLAQLRDLVGMGQSATAQQVGTASTGYGGKLQQRGTSYGGQMQSAGTIGQGIVAGANAEQSALQGLLGAATYLGGAYLGGPAFAAGSAGTSLLRR